jgi:CBS-domain-containing membrane protein
LAQQSSTAFLLMLRWSSLGTAILWWALIGGSVLSVVSWTLRPNLFFLMLLLVQALIYHAIDQRSQPRGTATPEPPSSPYDDRAW